MANLRKEGLGLSAVQTKGVFLGVIWKPIGPIDMRNNG